MVMFFGSSGVACTSTGTCRFASRSVSAIARSSPKFGSVTRITIDAVAILFEEFNATANVFTGGNCAALGFLRRQHYSVHAGFLQHCNHLFSPRVRQMIGKESTVADDKAHGHFLF